MRKGEIDALVEPREIVFALRLLALRPAALQTDGTDAKLRQICTTVLSILFDYRDFVCVISDYLAQLRRAGETPVTYIKRHTIGLRRIMHSLIIEAKSRGEYEKSINPTRAIALLYSQFEATTVRITTTGGADLSEAIDRTNAILAVMRAPDAPARLFN